MSFDAGTIKGSIDLDTSKFAKGMDDVKGKAQEGSQHVAEQMEHLNHSIGESFEHGFEKGKEAAKEGLEKIVEVGKEGMEKLGAAFGEVGHALSEAFGPAVGEVMEKLGELSTAFDEGLLIGGIAAVGVALAAVGESVEIVSAKFHQMGLEALKAGTSVDFLARLAAVGGTVGVSLEQIGMGFRILEQRAEEAGQGSKSAVEGFERLGISVEEAGRLAKNPEALFGAVKERLGAMTDASARTADALAVLGRQGTALVPLFAMSRQEFDETADTMARMHGVVTKRSAEMGEAFGKLEGFIGAAMQGIETALATPVLEYLEKHLDEIIPKVETFATALEGDIGQAWESVEAGVKKSIPVLEKVWEVVSVDLMQAWKDLQPEMENVKGLFASFTGMNMADLVRSIHTVDLEFEKVAKIVAIVTDQIAKLIEAYTDALGITDPNVRFGHPYNLKPGQTTQEYLDEKAKQSPADTPATAPGGPRADAGAKDYFEEKKRSDDEHEKLKAYKVSPEDQNRLGQIRDDIGEDVDAGRWTEAAEKTEQLRKTMQEIRESAAKAAADLAAAMDKVGAVNAAYIFRPDLDAGLKKQESEAVESREKGDVVGAIKIETELLDKLYAAIANPELSVLRPGATAIDVPVTAGQQPPADSAQDLVPDSSPDDVAPVGIRHPKKPTKEEQLEDAGALIPDEGFLTPPGAAAPPRGGHRPRRTPTAHAREETPSPDELSPDLVPDSSPDDGFLTPPGAGVQPQGGHRSRRTRAPQTQERTEEPTDDFEDDPQPENRAKAIQPVQSQPNFVIPLPPTLPKVRPDSLVPPEGFLTPDVSPPPTQAMPEQVEPEPSSQYVPEWAKPLLSATPGESATPSIAKTPPSSPPVGESVAVAPPLAQVMPVTTAQPATSPAVVERPAVPPPLAQVAPITTPQSSPPPVAPQPSVDPAEHIAELRREIGIPKSGRTHDADHPRYGIPDHKPAPTPVDNYTVADARAFKGGTQKSAAQIDAELAAERPSFLGAIAGMADRDIGGLFEAIIPQEKGEPAPTPAPPARRAPVRFNGGQDLSITYAAQKRDEQAQDAEAQKAGEAQHAADIAITLKHHQQSEATIAKAFPAHTTPPTAAHPSPSGTAAQQLTKMLADESHRDAQLGIPASSIATGQPASTPPAITPVGVEPANPHIPTQPAPGATGAQQPVVVQLPPIPPAQTPPAATQQAQTVPQAVPSLQPPPLQAQAPQANQQATPPAVSDQIGDALRRTMADFATGIERVLSPMSEMGKGFSATTVSVNALSGSFESLRQNIGNTVNRLTEGGRQSSQSQTAAGNVTQNITVSVQYDPRESAKQFADKVYPALREITRRHDQQLAGAMAVQLAGMSVGGDDV